MTVLLPNLLAIGAIVFLLVVPILTRETNQ